MRRNTERQDHPLVKEFMRLCQMYDLQGLLMDEKDNFTAAVEAFTFAKDEKPERARDITDFSNDQWLAILTLSEALHVSLNVFLHQDGAKTIKHYSITKAAFVSGESIESGDLTEREFVKWWATMKRTKQIKEYREEMTSRIKESYFDNLLEAHNLKWGGNIDSFLVLPGKDYKPLALIENRITTKYSLKKYDPAVFYESDRRTWLPLFLICNQLQIPLFLCTYSKIENETNELGISQVDTSHENTLKYIDDIKPYERRFSDLQKARLWLYYEAIGFVARGRGVVDEKI